MSNIRKQLRSLGITQSELAEAMKVSPQYISAFLNGETDNVNLEVRIKKWLQQRKTYQTELDSMPDKTTS